MLKARWLCVCLWTILTTLTFGQTLVDLRTQTKTVDFSGANATKPFKSGATLPSTCQVGEMFYNTAATSGANLFGCTALNSWTLQSGSTLPAVFQNSGKILTTDGTNLLWSSPGGDLSGTLTAATVTQLQGRPVSSTQPTSGQVLGWNGTTTRWEPQTVTGTSGTSGSGATSSAGLTDFVVSEVNSTSLTIGSNCGSATPCSARIGSITYRFTSGAIVTLSGGSGIAYVYISSAGTLTVGHNLTLACSAGCLAQSGVTSFPVDSIPLWIWSAYNGTWNATGTDERAMLSTKSVIAGLGITTSDQAGQAVIAIDPTVVSVQVATPATSATACTQGAWATDQSFYYICVANNVWKKVALSSW